MARSDPGEALTTAWELLFLSNEESGGADGENAKVFRITNLSTSAGNIQVYVAPLHGGAAAPGDSTVGEVLEPGQTREFYGAAGGKGTIRGVWARAASTATATYSVAA